MAKRKHQPHNTMLLLQIGELVTPCMLAWDGFNANDKSDNKRHSNNKWRNNGVYSNKLNKKQQAHVHAASMHYSPSGSGMSVNLNHSKNSKKNNNKMNNNNNMNIQDEWDATTVKVRYQVESPEAPPFLLSEKTMQLLLEQALPPAIAYSRWKRIYCLARDGDDFGEFLRKCAPHQYTLLVIQTTFGEIFGGYVESTWTMHPDGFYGLGQACLYTLRQHNEKHYCKCTSGRVPIGICKCVMSAIA